MNWQCAFGAYLLVSFFLSNFTPVWIPPLATLLLAFTLTWPILYPPSIKNLTLTAALLIALSIFVFPPMMLNADTGFMPPGGEILVIIMLIASLCIAVVGIAASIAIWGIRIYTKTENTVLSLLLGAILALIMTGTSVFANIII